MTPELDRQARRCAAMITGHGACDEIAAVALEAESFPPDAARHSEARARAMREIAEQSYLAACRHTRVDVAAETEALERLTLAVEAATGSILSMLRSVATREAEAAAVEDAVDGRR